MNNETVKLNDHEQFMTDMFERIAMTENPRKEFREYIASQEYIDHIKDMNYVDFMTPAVDDLRQKYLNIVL